MHLLIYLRHQIRLVRWFVVELFVLVVVVVDEALSFSEDFIEVAHFIQWWYKDLKDQWSINDAPYREN